MKEQTCCFTGHRIIPEKDLCHVSVATEVAIRNLILNHGVRYFGVGGALGFDTLAADILFRLRGSVFPDIKVILVCPFEGFTGHWNPVQQQRYSRPYPDTTNVSACPKSPPRMLTWQETDIWLIIRATASPIAREIPEERLTLFDTRTRKSYKLPMWLFERSNSHE